MKLDREWSGEKEFLRVKTTAQCTRRMQMAVFKAWVALAAIREDKNTAELCKWFEAHATQIAQWKRQLLVV